jgi:hypothetical protein
VEIGFLIDPRLSTPLPGDEPAERDTAFARALRPGSASTINADAGAADRTAPAKPLSEILRSTGTKAS